MDTITHQIVQQVSALPFAKKKALFELLKQEHAPRSKPAQARKRELDGAAFIHLCLE